MITGMSFVPRKLAPLLLLPLLTQCGTTSAPETAAVTGPFDNRGNYIEDWVDQPDKWFKPNTPGTKSKTSPLVAKNESRPTRETETFVSKPVRPPDMTPSKPEPTVVKVTPKPTPKPKPKPATVRHTVKKGDTLSGLASRYGSSVSKIKTANKISGSVIRLGQTLTIPK